MNANDPLDSTVAPLLDTDKLRTFIIIGHDQYVELLDEVMREVPEELARLRETIERQELTECKACAHSLQGILAYFGCVAMTRKLQLLQRQQAIEPGQGATLQQEMLALWQQSLGALREWERTVPGFAPAGE